MLISKRRKRLLDAYRFTGFRPLERVRGIFGDPKARVISLVRRSKKHVAALVGVCTLDGTTTGFAKYAICRVATPVFTWNSSFVGLPVEAAAR
jgi:hypothetical protein